MPETISVSNYELLVRPIIDSTDSPNRTVIQGYFLTIANPSSSDLEIELTFRATTPNFTSSDFVAFWDVSGANLIVVPDPDPSITTASYRFNLPPLDTGLFILLPNVADPGVIPAQNTEIRGYVRLSIPTATQFPLDSGIRRLLLSVQQRGTFLPQGATNPPEVGDYDQFSYSLPTANGGAEVEVEVVDLLPLVFNADLRQLISDAIETNPGLISTISTDSFAESISKLTPDEQRAMLKSFLERLDTARSLASVN